MGMQVWARGKRQVCKSCMVQHWPLCSRLLSSSDQHQPISSVNGTLQRLNAMLEPRIVVYKGRDSSVFGWNVVCVVIRRGIPPLPPAPLLHSTAPPLVNRVPAARSDGGIAECKETAAGCTRTLGSARATAHPPESMAQRCSEGDSLRLQLRLGLLSCRGNTKLFKDFF